MLLWIVGLFNVLGIVQRTPTRDLAEEQVKGLA